MQTQTVLRVFLEDPDRELYGLEIAAHTGLLPGTTYPILDRLQRASWMTSRWETIDPRDEQRPRRRYYRLTPSGVELATQELERRSRRTASAARQWDTSAEALPRLVAFRDVTRGRDAS